MTSPSPTTPLAEATRRRLRYACTGVVIACAFLIAMFEHGRDQGIYAVVARTILEGGLPYRDAWDFKPPGIYFVYALGRLLAGRGMWGVRFIEAMGLLAASLGLVTLAKRWWRAPEAGYVGAALAALLHAQLDFWHTGQPETFGGMLLIAALLVATGDRATPRETWGAWIGSGILCGCAGLLKPPLAGAGVVIAFWSARHLEGTWPKRLRPVAGVLLGGVIPFAACLGWFAQKGGLDALRYTFVDFTPHYTALSLQARPLWRLCAKAVADWLLAYGYVVLIGWLAAAAWWRDGLGRRGVGLIGGILAMQLFGVALQAKYFPYHYGGIWPLSALVAGLGWMELARRAKARHDAGPLAIATLAAVALVVRSANPGPPGFAARSRLRFGVMMGEAGSRATRDALASAADVNATSNRRVAQAMARGTQPGDAIYVWGFEPVIYDLASRPAASRYIYNVPQRVSWGGARARQELMADLARRPPAMIAVVRGDPLPLVTGHLRDSATTLARGFPALGRWLSERYEHAGTIDDFELYRRKGVTGSAPR